MTRASDFCKQMGWDRAEDLAAVEGLLREQVEECVRVVREKCAMCNGTGAVVTSVAREAHGCDGSEASCSVTCPIAVEDYEQTECEYCGRPQEALRSLPPSAGKGKE